MKKYHLFVLLLLSIYGFANDSSRISTIEFKVKQLDSLMAKRDTSQILSNINKSHENHISILELTVTILAALVGIITILIPILIWFFEIRPAQRLLNEVKNIDAKVESKLKIYLKDLDSSKVNTALEEIKSNDEVKSREALTYLNYFQFYSFSEEQMFKIYSLLKSDVDINRKSVLSNILSKKPTSFGDEYFGSLIKSREPGLFQFINPSLRYYSLVGIDKIIPDLREIILTVSQQPNNANFIVQNYTNIGFQLMSISRTGFIQLVNDKVLNNPLDVGVRQRLYDNFFLNAKNFNLYKELNSSLLAAGVVLK